MTYLEDFCPVCRQVTMHRFPDDKTELRGTCLACEYMDERWTPFAGVAAEPEPQEMPDP